MSNDDQNSMLDAITASLRCTTKLIETKNNSDKLTPEFLAVAIRLAALSTDVQEKLTVVTVNDAIKLAANSSGHEQIAEEEYNALTAEKLATALKLVVKSDVTDNDEKASEDISTEKMVTTIKAAVALTQYAESQELITPDTLSHALELAKK